MATNWLTSLLKKDPDAQVVEVTHANTGLTQLYLETDQDGERLIPDDVLANDAPSLHLPSLGDPHLIENAASEPLMDVEVQLVYYTFIVSAGVSFVAMILSSVPYWLLSVDETRAVAAAALWAFAIIAAALYALLAAVFHRLTRHHRALLLWLFVGWVFSATMATGALAAVLRKLAPIQFVTVIWVQSVTMIAYAKLSFRYVSPTWAMCYMLLSTLVVWGVCIYAFVVENDWISGCVVLLLGVAMVAYHTAEIRAIQGRGYAVSAEDRIDAVMRYYVDPLLGLWWALKWPYKELRRRKRQHEQRQMVPLETMPSAILAESAEVTD